MLLTYCPTHNIGCCMLDKLAFPDGAHFPPHQAVQTQSPGRAVVSLWVTAARTSAGSQGCSLPASHRHKAALRCGYQGALRRPTGPRCCAPPFQVESRHPEAEAGFGFSQLFMAFPSLPLAWVELYPAALHPGACPIQVPESTPSARDRRCRAGGHQCFCGTEVNSISQSSLDV